MNTQRIAEQIAKAARAMGIDANLTASGLSEAQYIETPYGKIRVATHDARPTYEREYGAAAYTVGTVVRRDGRVETAICTSDGDWLSCVAWLAARAGVELPARYARLIARRDAAVAIEAKRAAEFQAARVAEADAAEANWASALAYAREHTPERVAALDTAQGEMGKAARKRRQNLRNAIYVAWQRANS